MSNEQKTGYKYKLGFHQSLTTGIVGFEGYVNFDHGEEHENKTYGNMQQFDYAHQLLLFIENVEETFKRAGYRVASDIEPKVQPVKNGQSKEEVKR